MRIIDKIRKAKLEETARLYALITDDEVLAGKSEPSGTEIEKTIKKIDEKYKLELQVSTDRKELWKTYVNRETGLVRDEFELEV